MNQSPSPGGIDFAQGVSVVDIPEGGVLPGRVGTEDVLLVRAGSGVFATGASCSHYHGPLAEGLVVGDTIRCPWHHACFSLRTGEALAAPALNPIPCWRVERRDDRVFVREKLPVASWSSRAVSANSNVPESVLIVGGGAAGDSAAATLRACGYERPVTVLSADDSPPCDRPNLSKDYLAGTAPAEWLWLRPDDFYRTQDITLQLNTRVSSIDPGRRTVRAQDGRELSYGALLLATGAEPVRLTIPGGELPHVRYVRTPSDSRAIIVAADQGAKRAVVIGASFIGLEVAASLRARAMEVHVVAPEARPLERVFGLRLGDFIRALHESKGVTFHLGRTVSAIGEREVTLDDGERVPADLVVVGIGVRPAVGLAEQAGIKTDRGVLVNEYLETSAPGIYAAGDIARFPYQLNGAPIRVEHWAVAQRQGQTAAHNLLGQHEHYSAVPFFWSQHYDISLNYVGHAERWDSVDIDGDPEQHDCAVTYRQDQRVLAMASIFRDRQSLEMEVRMEEVLRGS